MAQLGSKGASAGAAGTAGAHWRGSLRGLCRAGHSGAAPCPPRVHRAPGRLCPPLRPAQPRVQPPRAPLPPPSKPPTAKSPAGVLASRSPPPPQGHLPTTRPLHSSLPGPAPSSTPRPCLAPTLVRGLRPAERPRVRSPSAAPSAAGGSVRWEARAGRSQSEPEPRPLQDRRPSVSARVSAGLPCP